MREQVRAQLDEMLGSVRPLHWPLEFPEVFFLNEAGHHQGERERVGFDAIIGNPPFIGGQRITGALGVPYRNYLVEAIARGQRGSADLVAYFYLRGFDLLAEGGHLGLIATNTIAQGDTREVGLDQIVNWDGLIHAANPSRKWPGQAALEVALVHIVKGEWKISCALAEKAVSAITPYLSEPGEVVGNPHRLAANAGKSFIGSFVLGMGFVLTPDEAAALIEKDVKNTQVLFPYLNGEDLNSRPDQSPSRWVINFRDWPLNRETAPPDYEGFVAADFPDCLQVLEEKVKPERTRTNQTAICFAKTYRKIGGFTLKNVLHFTKQSRRYPKYWLLRKPARFIHSFVFVPNEWVYGHKLVVFSLRNFSDLSVLS